jgi:AAA domain
VTPALQALCNDADRVIDEAIEHALFGSSPVAIVKSPPGAGKTFLVECAAAVAVTPPSGMRVAIVTPGVSQLYDIGRRLLDYILPRLVLVHAQHRVLPLDLVGRITASNGWNPGLNTGPGVIVTNAHLLAANFGQVGPGAFDLMIIDEAYQLSASDYLPIAHMAVRVLMVGDPGQLDPVRSADTTNLESGQHKIHWSAPAYVLDRFPATSVFGLPVTRRLLPDTSDLVQASFYPDLPFQSVVDPLERRLRFPVPGVERGVDQALDAVASGQSLVAIVVPGKAPAHEEADLALADVIAHLADRVLTRQGEWVGVRALGEDDVGCIDPHVIAGGAISDGLRQRGRGGMRVDTVERWQGLQMPISIVRHPLSLPNRPTGFDLEAGRWCVSLSRHQIGCIIVARESVTEMIDGYVHGCDTVAAGAKDKTWAGFQAHRRIWNTLRDQGRIFSL